MPRNFAHADHLNTAREIYNSSQQLVWRRPHQEPFGNSPPDENPSGLGVFEFPLRESSYYDDKESGMQYAMKRDCYDPATGRFCQPDPIGVDGIAGHNGIVDARPMSALGIDALALAELSDEEIQFVRALTISRPPFISDYNLYLYANGNPLSRIDPDGLFPVDPLCISVQDFCKRFAKNWRMIVFYILCSIGDKRPPPPPPRPPRPPLENPAPPKPPGPPPKPPAAPPSK